VEQQKPIREDRYTELAALIGAAGTTIGTVVLAPLIGAGVMTPPVIMTGLVVLGTSAVAYILQRGWVKSARAKRDTGSGPTR